MFTLIWVLNRFSLNEHARIKDPIATISDLKTQFILLVRIKPRSEGGKDLRQAIVLRVKEVTARFVVSIEGRIQATIDGIDADRG